MHTPITTIILYDQKSLSLSRTPLNTIISDVKQNLTADRAHVRTNQQTYHIFTKNMQLCMIIGIHLTQFYHIHKNQDHRFAT
jgi:hypothetical protein